MQCQELELVLLESGKEPLPATAQAHLEGCEPCRNLINDLERIVVAARELPAEVEPPDRIWVSLLAHLEAEKIIRPEPAPSRSSPSPWRSRFLRPAMAMAAVSALVIAIVVVRLRNGAGPSSPSPVISDRAPLSPVFTNAKQQLDSIESTTVASSRSHDASVTDASLRENLKIVNDFIASCERSVRTTPQNDLARDYLSGAYQQKAELLAAIQDRSSTGD